MFRLSTSFIDLFLILLFNFIILWVLSMTLISIKDSDDPTPPDGNGIKIVVTWPVEADADVDLWAKRDKNPNSITGFIRRENDVFVLHNDNTSINYGKVDNKILDIAKEEMTISKPVPDTYYFSLHGYNLRKNHKVVAHVQIFQIKPYSVIVDKDVTVYNGVESPICAFRLDSKDRVHNIITREALLRKIIK